jgi:hypothetical protein
MCWWLVGISCGRGESGAAYECATVCAAANSGEAFPRRRLVQRGGGGNYGDKG